ncbi:uncharacterized protein [Solanum lycopersicum]|uniref:uncharacterized protein isoform X1 n=1 Tax=Solanum lycopersicum TaxID=4081 RepID=UPI000E1CA894|nr:uncharacterized protein LOC101250282 [Solanum lycopersicum]
MGKRKEFTVILARNIGISGYEDLSLQRRFNSTIRINPTYPHALKLISWATTNKDVLVGNVSGNFAGSSTALNKNLNHQRVISIAELAKTASVMQRAADEPVDKLYTSSIMTDAILQLQMHIMAI